RIRRLDTRRAPELPDWLTVGDPLDVSPVAGLAEPPRLPRHLTQSPAQFAPALVVHAVVAEATQGLVRGLVGVHSTSPFSGSKGAIAPLGSSLTPDAPWRSIASRTASAG